MRVSGFRQRSGRGLPLLVAAATAGCSLVVGDIELPAEQSAQDMGGLPRDADTDAAPGGAVVPSDAAPPVADVAPPPADGPPIVADTATPPPPDALVPPPDAALPPPADAYVAPPDVGVDAFIPQADLSGIAGYWYVAGFAVGDRGVHEAFSAALRVNRRSADLRSNLGELIAEDVSLVPARDQAGTWLFTMPTTGVVYRGAFAPGSGFAIFAPDSRQAPGATGSLLLLARANEDAPVVPPDSLAYVRVGRAPADGDGEFGTLRQTGPDGYLQEYRYPAPPVQGLLPDRALDLRNIDPWRWSLRDPVTDAEFELMPTFHGQGVIAVERLPDEGGVGLLLGWTGLAPDALPRAGDLYCFGIAWDPTGPAVTPIALPASMPGDGTLAWVGGYRQTLTASGGVYTMANGLNPFLQGSGIALGDALDEVLVIMPFNYETASTVWGMMACVRTDLLPAPL